jgi:allantoin racemase
MSKRILVINPNSNPAVTQGLRDALTGFANPNGPEIVCTQLDDGPFGIETQAHVDGAAMPLRAASRRTAKAPPS